jgi:hypothetical protein
MQLTPLDFDQVRGAFSLAPPWKSFFASKLTSRHAICFSAGADPGTAIEPLYRHQGATVDRSKETKSLRQTRLRLRAFEYSENLFVVLLNQSLNDPIVKMTTNIEPLFL